MLSTAFKEAIMDTRILLLSAVAAGGVALFAASALADEGTVTAKVSSTGTQLQTNPVGTSGDNLVVSEENGTIERGGGSHPWRCFWMSPIIKQAWEAQGYCIETDQDGDQIVLKTTSKGSDGAASGAGEVILGTGKYAGTTGKIAFTCHLAGGSSKYSANCDAQVSYKTPDKMPDKTPEPEAKVAEFYELAKPAGDGPFPAVVLAPGCGGFHDQYSPPVFDQYRKRLVEAGFVVVNVDFTKGHDIPTCFSGKGMLITQEDYSKDILRAVADLKKNGFVDPARIHLLGWSFGGGAALNALALAEEQPDAKIKSVVAYFPYCGAVRPWKQQVPVLILRGDADDIALFGMCKSAVQAALDNKSMRDVVYPGALHSFDQFTVPQPVKDAFGTHGYNEAATKNAWRELETFLKE
jgi:dienelactone hydrolase